MSRLIQFVHIKHHLPGLSWESALNARCAGNLDYLSHTGPDGRYWSRLWADIDKLHRWAHFRNLAFSPELEEIIRKRAVHPDGIPFIINLEKSG